MPEKPAGWDEPDRLNRENREPVPASDAPTCKCDVEIRRSKAASRTVHVLMCPLHTFAPDLYAALEELLKAGQHEGPCDNCDPETGKPYDEAGACEAHLKACEARRKIAKAALAKARGEKP